MFAGMASADSVIVPAGVQAALLTKIWTFDRNFHGKEVLTVAVLYQRLHRPSWTAHEEIVKAARAHPSLRMVSIEIDDGELSESEMAGVDVAYVTPLRAVDVRNILSRIRSRNIRTVTSTPAYVGRGVAVGITTERDRPLLIVDLEAARLEGADFSSQLLKLARVVR